MTLAPGGSISGRVTSDAGAPLHRVAGVQPARQRRATTPTPTAPTSIEGVEHRHARRVASTTRSASTSVSTGTTSPTDDPGRRQPRSRSRPARPWPASTRPSLRPSAAAPNGVDVSGTVRDELGGIGVGYHVDALRHPGRPRRRAKVVATTIQQPRRPVPLHRSSTASAARPSSRSQVAGRQDAPRGGRLRSAARRGRATSSATTPLPSRHRGRPRTLDFTLPVAGGVSGAVTSEAGGVPRPGRHASATATERRRQRRRLEMDGTYDDAPCGPATTPSSSAATDHVSEWWKNALPRTPPPSRSSRAR